MKRLKRFLIVILSLTSAISLTVLVSKIIFRIERRSWIITTAEITFIGTEDGLVFGTFTDCNGQVHSEHRMYNDGKFQKISIFTPWAKNPEPYLGTTVRIMYNPSTLALEEISHSFTNKDGETVFRYRGIEIASYDNWLQDIIVSVSVFGVSIILLAVVLIRTIRKKDNRKA